MAAARFVVGLVFFVMPSLAILSGAEPARPSTAVVPAAESLSTTIERGSFRSVLRPITDLQLSSPAAGIISAIHIPEGEKVKAGQAILSLDADEEKAEVAQAEAALRGAEAESERSAAEFDRVSQLRTENIQSEKMYVDAKAQAATAKARRDQAAAALQSAKVRLANRSLTSPIDGIFLKATKEVGEAVERYEPVVRVVDVTSLEMTVFCNGAYFSRFKAGQKLEIRVFKSAEEQPIISGIIIHTDPIIDPSTGTFRVKIKIDPSPNAVPGLSAFIVMPK